MGKASRKKQERYAGVDGLGRPLFAEPDDAPAKLAGVPLSWLLAIVAVSMWAGAHLFGSYSYIAGAGYVITGVLLGLVNPGLGAAVTVALVPFYGGEMSQGLGELVRSLYQRVAGVRYDEPHVPPPQLPVGHDHSG